MQGNILVLLPEYLPDTQLTGLRPSLFFGGIKCRSVKQYLKTQSV
jgi:hypothetical protein